MSTMVAPWRLVLAVVGLLVAAGGVVTLLTPVPGLDVVAASGADPTVAWSILAAAVALIGAATVAWASHPGAGLALIAVWAAAAWLAPELIGSESVPGVIRTAGRLLVPMLAPLVVHLTVRALRRDRGLVRAAILALYAAAAVAAVGHALTWDPWLVIQCAPFCQRGDNLLAAFPDKELGIASRVAGSAVWLVGGLGLAVWAAARLRARMDARDRAVLVAALLTGGGLVAQAWAWIRADPEVTAPDPWVVGTTVVLAFAVAALGTIVAWTRIRDARRASALRLLADVLDAQGGARSLQDSLGRLLNDPTIRVAYPIDEGCVDDLGRPVAPPSSGGGRAVLTIERGGRPIALVEHDLELDADLLATQVGAAARLAVDNERLAATLRARVRDLQASRERIVSAGDAARGRLERDLHDGAQQRLLAVSYELRLAQAAVSDEPAERRAAIDAAVIEIDRALSDVRDLAHGIWPAVLAEAGLDAALSSLAEESPIPIELTGIPDGRFPDGAEAAAYLSVREALRRAVGGGAAARSVRAGRPASELRVEVRVPGLAATGPWHRVHDRVGAAGGRSEVTVDPAVGTLLVVDLPCA